jgi:hypothetical protein
MARKTIKSFTINSILAESAPESETNIDEEAELCAEADGSDCESDLDVTGDDTPPLDCSQKSAENKELSEGKQTVGIINLNKIELHFKFYRNLSR